MELELPESEWSEVSDRIALALGMHFPVERRLELRRGFARAAHELEFPSVAAFRDWLLANVPGKRETQVLARHLTVGETYFFREAKTLQALREHILPPLIHRRREEGKRLRLWSAACCSGEEPYTLAIILSQLIPDLADWHVTILGTDLNETFLQKGAEGVYSEWSFRETPPEMRARYFQPQARGRWVIREEIRQMVTFAQLNLAEDAYPSLATGTNAMDVIFCRNVLIYFGPEQTRKVVKHLRLALVEGGWLAVSPTEVSQTIFAEYQTHNFPGAILYQKTAARVASPVHLPRPLECFEPRPELTPLARPPVRERRSPHAFAAVEQMVTKETPAAHSVEIHALANAGRLHEALAACDRWVAAEKISGRAHYLRAVVLQELGEPARATRALQRVLFLQPDFALAHFALGNLARAAGQHPQAQRHFRNLLALLHKIPVDDSIPESDGLTAGRLTEIVQSILKVEPKAA